MASPFLEGALGDPKRLQRRIAPQSTKGLPAVEADFVDFRGNGGPMGISSGTVERAVVQQAGVPGRRLVGKFAIGGGPLAIGDIDPTNLGMLHLLGNLMGAWTRTDNTSWQKYIFDTLQGGTTADPFLSLLNDNDVIPRHRFHDARVGSVTLAAGPNENLLISFAIGAPEFDFHGPVTQTIGSGSSLPKFRRTWDGNQDPDATDSDLFIDITAVNGSTDFTWRGKVGTAAAYSASNAAQPFDQWFQFRDENGDLVGRQEEHVMCYISSTPGLTALDEFEVTKRRVRWAQTLAVEQPIASAQSLFLQAAIGSTLVQTRVEGGWELTYAFPTFENRGDTSGRQGGNQRRTGSPTVVLTLTRDLVDLEFQQGILSGAEVSCVIDARNNAIIGASSRYHRFMALLPAMLMEGETFDADEGAESIEESITLNGYAPTSTFNYVADGETYSTDAHCAFCVETDQVISVASA